MSEDSSELPQVCVTEVVKNCGYFENFNEITPIFDKVYEINGEVFREDIKIDDKLVKFEVWRNRRERRKKMGKELCLDVDIQESSYGIIINSNILIPEAHWHTIVPTGEDLTCFVCDSLIESLDHVYLEEHKDRLNKYRPLKKFDLSITRVIGDHYHCAVCNEVFHKSDKHFSNKEHEEKMLYATNKASDVMFNFGLSEKKNGERNGDEEEYHFDRNRICDGERTSEQSEHSENYDGFYDYVAPEFDEHDINHGFSYAAMAKKPAVVPKYVVSDEQHLKIRFDEWHMISKLDRNRFYCFSCKTFGHIGQKAQHCMDEEHLKKLRKCKVVDRYKKYFVRQVDHKLVHCALCNTLQFISDMDDHIQRFHDKKFKCDKLPNGDLKPNIIEQEPPNCDLNSANPINPTLLDRSIMWRQESEINNISPGIFNDVIINQFNCTLRVSFLSYNLITRRVNDYFCGICNLSLSEVMAIHHVQDSRHIELLKTLPFESYFGLNLLRLVHHRVHCTLCNVVFDTPLINIHINELTHATLLYQSLIVPNYLQSNHNDSTLANEMNDDVNDDSSTFKNQAVNSTISRTVNVDASTSQNQETDLNESLESEESIESYNYEHIVVKLGNAYVKVTYTSYNSLVSIGDGTRYCFVCSAPVFDLKNHIESRSHVTCMKNCKFLNKYDKHLFRQNFLLYHCCLCNVMFTKKDLSSHLFWHQRDVKSNKKVRKRVRKSKIKVVEVQTQKEEVYLKEQEPNVNVIGRFSIVPQCSNSPSKEVKKKNKYVILGGKVLKISWDSWQGLHRCKDGVNCILCSTDLKQYEISTHVTSKWHSKMLEKTIDREYLPNLIRNVNGTKLNCVTCNTSVSNKKHIISEHLNSYKHKHSYDIICSTPTDGSTDCNEDVLHL